MWFWCTDVVFQKVCRFRWRSAFDSFRLVGDPQRASIEIADPTPFLLLRLRRSVVCVLIDRSNAVMMSINVQNSKIIKKKSPSIVHTHFEKHPSSLIVSGFFQMPIPTSDFYTYNMQDYVKSTVETLLSFLLQRTQPKIGHYCTITKMSAEKLKKEEESSKEVQEIKEERGRDKKTTRKQRKGKVKKRLEELN